MSSGTYNKSTAAEFAVPDQQQSGEPEFRQADLSDSSRTCSDCRDPRSAQSPLYQINARVRYEFPLGEYKAFVPGGRAIQRGRLVERRHRGQLLPIAVRDLRCLGGRRQGRLERVVLLAESCATRMPARTPVRRNSCRRRRYCARESRASCSATSSRTQAGGAIAWPRSGCQSKAGSNARFFCTFRRPIERAMQAATHKPTAHAHRDRGQAGPRAARARASSPRRMTAAQALPGRGSRESRCAVHAGGRPALSATRFPMRSRRSPSSRSCIRSTEDLFQERGHCYVAVRAAEPAIEAYAASR